MPVILYYDNTRISTYRECNRKFYLRHILDLVRDGERVDLVFGQCWHEAMNVVWRVISDGGKHEDALKMGMAAFISHWVEKEFPPPTSANYQILTDKWPTKNPYVAMEMLDNYIKQRSAFIKECTNVEVERPYAVPLGMTVDVPVTQEGDMPGRIWRSNEKGVTAYMPEEVFYIGRLDKVVTHRQYGRLIIEHKTTGWYAKEGGFRTDYLESFSPNSQVDGYLFAGNSLYEGGVKGVWVDAALTHKTVHDKFKFIPIDRQFTALDAWLTETKIYVRRIVGEINELEKDGNDVGAFPVFPKNTSSCHTYSGCSYRDVCKYIPNPRELGIPSGFRVEKWEPFDILKIGEIMQRKGD